MFDKSYSYYGNTVLPEVGTLIIRNGIYSLSVGKRINVNMFVFIEDVRCIVNH